MDLGLQGLVDLVFFRNVIAARPQQVPQDILVVRGDESRHRPAHQAADAPVQGRVVPLAESLGTVFHERPARIGGFRGLLAHPEVGNHGLVERLHFFLQVRAQLVPLLPVPALHRFHVLHGGVIEVGGEALLARLLLDLRQDFRLLLGAVGLGGLFILFPQGGQHVAVLVGRGVGVHHRGNE